MKGAVTPHQLQEETVVVSWENGIELLGEKGRWRGAE